MNPTARIHILPDDVANLIAAGEVVERPASVIKELVENALDAGATEIEVETADAGFSLLRVSDNGSGMSREDAGLAFQRHATSKLVTAEDLTTITSYGFRGEALPSIASVSRIELTTRPQAQTAGFRLSLEAGALREQAETGCSSGTTFIVRDLFFNTPARRKFMKSPATEQAHLLQTVEWAAVANLQTRFRFIADGREILNCPATDSLEERLAAIYGKSLPKPLYPVSREGGGVWVQGLVAGAEASRPTRQEMHLFTNGRPVEHRGLFHAIAEGYKPLLPSGRFPWCFILLTIPPHLVDVNVHPAKREIRLRDDRGMHDLLMAAVRDALRQSQASGLPVVQPQANPAVPGNQAIPEAKLPLYTSEAKPPAWSSGRIQESVATYLQQQSDAAHREYPRPETPTAPAGADASKPAAFSDQDRVLGQVGRTYIAGQDQDGFYLIDQHAAHERILYEELLHQTEVLARQSLLLPQTFDLPTAQAFLLSEHLELFNQLGMEISGFGKNTFVLRSQPQFWQQGNLVAMITEVLAWITELGKPPATEELKAKTLKLMACHAAVKAGDRLQQEAMQGLVARLQTVPQPWTCPHGRPFFYRLSWQDLDRLFHRA